MLAFIHLLNQPANLYCLYKAHIHNRNVSLAHTRTLATTPSHTQTHTLTILNKIMSRTYSIIVGEVAVSCKHSCTKQQ